MPDEIDISLDGGTDASPSEPVVEETIDYGLSESFLNQIPEEHRGIVGKYVKNWDGTVTKKFQDIHEQYKPYKELGELEELQRAAKFANEFRQNGEGMFGKMLKGFFETYGDQAYARLNELMGIQTQQEAGEMAYNDDGEWEDFANGEEEPDPRDIQLANMAEKLEQFEQWQAEQQEKAEMAEASSVLDNLVSQIHTARNDIPEEFILDGFAAMKNPQQIVESWDSWFGGRQTNGQQPVSTSRPLPPNVGGQGGVPSAGQVDVKSLDKQGRMALAEQWLANAQGQ